MDFKTFRSEDEQLSSLLDETQGNYPFLRSEDPVIFHNAEYERELLMAYNLDFGESCSTTLGEEEYKPNIEPKWETSPSESEVTTTTKYRCDRYTPYHSGPLIKPSSLPKRGRPQKATSDTKMATYARNYREQKKTELASALVRMKVLEAELGLAREENQKMQKALVEANSEISQLRKVIDQDSQIANVVARMSDRCMSPLSFESSRATGVCVHVGTKGTTVEVCKQCADNSQKRVEMKSKLEDIEPTLLFNGDFASIESFLDV